MSALLLGGGAIVIMSAGLSRKGRLAGLVPAATGVTLLVSAPSWDRELLASGVYKYAARIPENVEVEVALKAGTLLYYRDGAASTVSVRQLSGALSLAIDGKVDASTAATCSRRSCLPTCLSSSIRARVMFSSSGLGAVSPWPRRSFIPSNGRMSGDLSRRR